MIRVGRIFTCQHVVGIADGRFHNAAGGTEDYGAAGSFAQRLVERLGFKLGNVNIGSL